MSDDRMALAGAQNAQRRASSATDSPTEQASTARALCETERFGMLATVTIEPAGYPFGSLVGFALDEVARPLLLLSGLAEHTRNLKSDPRASLLVCDPAPGAADLAASSSPLARARVTLLGRVTPVDPAEQEAARWRYLERHPDAQLYLQLPDFAFYRMEIEGARFVGGFGRMSWITANAFRQAPPSHRHPE